MIRFEFREASTSRHASDEPKALSPTIVSPEVSGIVIHSGDAFSLDMETPDEEQGAVGKTRKGRSKKFRGSPS